MRGRRSGRTAKEIVGIGNRSVFYKSDAKRWTILFVTIALGNLKGMEKETAIYSSELWVVT